MIYKEKLLRGIVTAFLRPTGDKADLPYRQGAARASDPIWQIGHAAFEVARVLILPFNPASRIAVRFGEDFDGENSIKP